MAGIYQGHNTGLAQKIMGRGGVIGSIKRPEKQEIKPSEKPKAPVSPSAKTE